MTASSLAYYTPIYALMNLFIHILQDPNQPSVESDLLLMEIGVGHFMRLELLTGFQTFTPFVKDISQMSRNAVEQARRAEKENIVHNETNFNAVDLADAPVLDTTGATAAPGALGGDNFDEVNINYSCPRYEPLKPY